MLRKIITFLLVIIVGEVYGQNFYSGLIKDLFKRDRPLPPKYADIQYAFVVEDCRHFGNSSPVATTDYNLINDYGLIVYWNRKINTFDRMTENNVNDTYDATDDLQGIFDCTMTIKLGAHDPRIPYQELIYGNIITVEYGSPPFYAKVEANITKLDPENTIANKGLKELQNACRGAFGDNCHLKGCIIIEYNEKVIKTCDHGLKNIGDELKWFTRDNVRIRILAIGAFAGKDKLNSTILISYPPINQKLRLEFTRLYGGPCYNKQQFYCRTHGVCIKYTLACDPPGMYNCPIYEGTKYDEPSQTECYQGYRESMPPKFNVPDNRALTNLYIFWAILGIFLALLAYLILNYCFWRPGYLIWRCGRIRNWCLFGNCCYKLCHDCSQSCNPDCCKTEGTYDTTEPSTMAWSKYPAGDGFHMRENR